MDTIGIDVHKKESQVCILRDDGKFLEPPRVPTTVEALRKLFGGRQPAKILMESSTESEWVARLLEEMGHEVVVADPNFAPMYATRNKKVKTDKRDARTLAEACRLGAYRPAHRVSDQQWVVRSLLTLRETVIRTRTKYISVVRSLLRHQGYRVPSGSPEHFLERVQRMGLPAPLLDQVMTVVSLFPAINEKVAEMDKQVEKITELDPQVRRLRTLPGVGPVTAAAYQAALDADPSRFRSAHQVQAYLGLVPRELSSGEKQYRGSITKAGNSRLRYLLVQGAWNILRYPRPDTEALAFWAAGIAMRRGRNVAAVALARRMAGILFAMLRDQTTYQPKRIHKPKPLASAA
jgi:transposase